jgi:ribosomal protein S18 acetylase RimI-like enzyme
MKDQEIISLLSETFEHNKSVDLLTNKNSSRRKQLMKNCLAQAKRCGSVTSTSDAVALSVFPEIKTGTFFSFKQRIHFATRVIPFSKIPLILERERYIKSIHPKEKCWYIYFIGVRKNLKRSGIGKSLIQQIEAAAQKENRTIILETSNPESLQFYLRLGFKIYHEWNWEKVNFTLWFLKK